MTEGEPSARLTTPSAGARAWPSPALPLVVAALPLVYDAYVFVGVRGGRDAFLARAGEPTFAGGVLGLALLAVGLLGHAVLGARAPKERDAHRGHATPGSRALQRMSAPVVAAFLLAHQRHSVFVAGIEGLGGAGLYQRVRDDVDGYGWLAVYVLGLGALALHAGQGAFASASRGRYAPPHVRRALAVGLVGLTVVGYLFLVNALAAFAVGAPLFFGP